MGRSSVQGLRFGGSQMTIRTQAITPEAARFISVALRDSERKKLCRKDDVVAMRPSEPWFSRRWYTGDVVALAALLLGLVTVLFVAATGGEYAVWTLWAAVPMIMFSLGYLFLVSALPIFLGPRSGSRPPEDSSGQEECE